MDTSAMIELGDNSFRAPSHRLLRTGKSTTVVGQQHQFPPPEASARYRFDQGTFAETRGNERDALQPVVLERRANRWPQSGAVTLCGYGPIYISRRASSISQSRKRRTAGFCKASDVATA